MSQCLDCSPGQKEAERSGRCGDVAVSGVSTVVQLFKEKSCLTPLFNSDIGMEVFFVFQRCAHLARALEATIACTSQQNR